MSEEERLKLENELLLTKSKAQMINMYLDVLSIIKEVREYVNKCHILDKEIQIDYCLDEDIKNDILNILDKVGDEK